MDMLRKLSVAWHTLEKLFVAKRFLTKLSNAMRNSKNLPNSTWLGAYAERDVTASEDCLRREIEANPSRDPHCNYWQYNGRTYCDDECLYGMHYEAPECPDSRRYRALRSLADLKIPQFLTMAFSTPSIATANRLIGFHFNYTAQ
jgi:hypothetical protein